MCLLIGGIGTPTTAAQSSTSPQRPQEARTPPPTTCRSTVPATAALDGRGRGCPGVRRGVCVGVCVGVEAPLLRTQGSKCPPGPQSLRRRTAPITNQLEKSSVAIAIAAVWRVETRRAGIAVGMGGSLHHTNKGGASHKPGSLHTKSSRMPPGEKTGPPDSGRERAVMAGIRTHNDKTVCNLLNC